MKLGQVEDRSRNGCSISQRMIAVRGDLTDGTIARVIFCIVDGEMVLLHGFVKKTQKTLSRDIDLALKRKRELD